MFVCLGVRVKQSIREAVGLTAECQKTPQGEFSECGECRKPDTQEGRKYQKEVVTYFCNTHWNWFLFVIIFFFLNGMINVYICTMCCLSSGCFTPNWLYMIQCFTNFGLGPYVRSLEIQIGSPEVFN